MLELAEVRERVVGFDGDGLVHRWRHVDEDVDALSLGLLGLVDAMQKRGAGREEIFGQVWQMATGADWPEDYRLMPRTAVPYLDEPWYC